MKPVVRHQQQRSHLTFMRYRAGEAARHRRRQREAAFWAAVDHYAESPRLFVRHLREAGATKAEIRAELELFSRLAKHRR